jgi:hypothetical protein
MEKMFERLITLFNRGKAEATKRLPIHAKSAAIKNEALKALPARQAMAKEHAPEMTHDQFLLSPMEPEPVVVNKPAAERNFSMPLPSSISGEEVAMVQHSVNKTSTEHFKYVEKPHTPVEKAAPKKPEDVIKYKIKPLNLQAQVEHKDTARSDVIVYGKS